MPTRLARSTPRQRLALTKLAADLQEAFDSLPGRFWSTHDQRQSYETVLRHLKAWAEWEEVDDER
ncbi:hypothetical protein KEC56_12615 [Microbacterium sp. YMB-B2]|uniref:Uncharacterized protein n=1 Tax=Microbacterium tenebrionis TaxID=2830665 RepID=A0A9X1S114_9MICO|nr:hypothetical protein [Microbacterium tenebrionis]MCC2030344.1 hypothetical protein [Microbacterium tenebrionis]